MAVAAIRPSAILTALPCQANDDCLTELHWLYDHQGIEKARRDLLKCLDK